MLSTGWTDDMKFNVKLAASEQDYLEKQYKEYIEKTTMTDKERNALKEWVMDGNSPYDNPMGLWKDSFHPVEFLEVYRDEEYIEEHTKAAMWLLLCQIVISASHLFLTGLHATINFHQWHIFMYLAEQKKRAWLSTRLRYSS